MEISPALRAAARRSLSLPAEALSAECDEEFFIASGPGGQHRNKTESGVRLVHRPTGVTVTATERRSQSQNRSAALTRLRERLQVLSHVPKRRVATRPTRGARERRLTEKRHTSERKAGRRDLE
jgi:protein subunit release factor B